MKLDFFCYSSLLPSRSSKLKIEMGKDSHDKKLNLNFFTPLKNKENREAKWSFELLAVQSSSELLASEYK